MRRVRTRGTVALATAVTAVVLGGCGSQQASTQPDGGSSFGWVVVNGATPGASLKGTLETVPGDPTDAGSPVFSDGTPDPTTSAPLAPDAPHYVACSRAAAPSSSTNLRPVPRIDASNAKQGGAQPLPFGVVRVESGGELALDDGRLAAGNGYDAGVGGGQLAVRVTTRKVLAPVTLAVLDSPAAGRRVAFVEVRITTKAPVRWTEEPNLDIVTDGGDGGFVRGTAEALRDDQTSTDAYIDAFYPNNNSASGNVCVQRITHTGQLDAVMFSTGYGDGGYPTFVGRDKDGAIASVVHYGDVLPWRTSGLPGTPPPADQTG